MKRTLAIGFSEKLDVDGVGERRERHRRSKT
jgi:hypothetical protein